MTIHCENKLCIYWEDDHCLCSSIELDNLGMCADCICISFSEEELAAKRKQLRQKLDREYSAFQ